ncbi:MAG TPA: BON domain-containing protein [Terriglobales bacterium]
MKARVCLFFALAVTMAVFAATIGCSKAPNDAQITSDVQSKINGDSGLAGKQVGVQTSNGAVTLSGNVDNDTQRDAAARYAAGVPGVKEVVNNLTVAPPPAPAAEVPPPAPAPEPEKPVKHKKAKPVDDNSQNQVAQNTPPPPPPAPTPVPAAAPAPPPPPPPPQKVTIAQGTTLAIRLVDTVDSETAQQGQTFHATLDSPLAVDGNVAIPAGYPIEGHVVQVQSAGKFAGQSLLVLQLDRLKAGDNYYNIQTDQWKKQGSSRGKNTAEKVGAGAGIGALIGALAGGGKGAAIGAASGGGLGAGVQAVTHSQQIKLAPETQMTFTLQAPVTVIPAQNPNSGRQKLNSPGSSSNPGNSSSPSGSGSQPPSNPNN